MRILNNSFNSELIQLKDEKWLENVRVAGKVAANALSLLEKEVKNETNLSLIELNNLAEQFILDNNCQLTFKGYKGFPAGVCISTNLQLVHGIPTDYHLRDGDIVSFDLGATFCGSIADTAITCIYGKPKLERHITLLKAADEALIKGINAIQVGKKLGCIGNAIHRCIKNYGFGTIEKYGGHGINTSEDGCGIPHASPFVSNRANADEGIRLQPGLVLAIEPMAVIGDTYTYVDKDGWTVICPGGLSSHYEHTVFIHEDNVEIITDRNIL